MSATTLEQLQTLFRQVLGRPDLVVSVGSSARDITGWDSLNHMRIIAEVEKHFGLTFSFDDVRNLQNVGDLVQLIDRKTLS
jgi:acyl carrier protein